MDNEETIKRIQELAPSVMELEFGCEVMYKTSGWGRNKYTITKVMRDDKYRINTLDDLYDLEDMAYGYDFEILGKPITLAVVLMAIKTLVCKRCKGAGGTLGSGLGYSECGDCGGDKYDLPEDFAGTEFELGDILDFWNLSKDNFNDQSKATKIFIGKLLVDKE